MLDDESATAAIQIVAAVTNENQIEWALVGGLAMVIYGGDRTTKDIDVITNKPQPLENAGRLRQGGERYIIKTSKKAVAVDWIVRKDEFKQLFQEAVEINGIPILTAEWLVILKFIAGRFTDQEDAVFLLGQKGLVNRDSIREKIVKQFGLAAWGLAKPGFQRWFDLADGKTREDERNQKDGYIDS